MADEMELLKEWIKTSKNIVFFGGAGVSTESNIPDFRSTDGLYNQEYEIGRASCRERVSSPV